MSVQQAEAQLRSRLSRVVRDELRGQCTPIETAGTAGRGVPDVELCLPGRPATVHVQAWLELKVHDVSNPARAKKIGHFRREQAKWLRDRAALGGRVGLFIMARLGPGKREHVLIPGEDAARLWIDQLRGGFPWNEIRELSSARPSPALRADWLREAVELL